MQVWNSDDGSGKKHIAYLGKTTQKTKDLKKSGILLSDKLINCLMYFELFCLPNVFHLPCPNPEEKF